MTYTKPKARTLIEMREARYAEICHLRKVLVPKGKRIREGMLYVFPTNHGHNLTDGDVMLLCGGWEGLGSFKSITTNNKGEYECLVADRTVEPDDDKAGATGFGISEAEAAKYDGIPPPF